jgi:hypothetical protein
MDMINKSVNVSCLLSVIVQFIVFAERECVMVRVYWEPVRAIKETLAPLWDAESDLPATSHLLAQSRKPVEGGILYKSAASGS